VRLDFEVSRRFSLSRRAAREAVRSGRIEVDGAVVDEPGVSVTADANLAFHRDRPLRRHVRTRLTVLHEDGDVLIVDKPAGLLTVPTEDREKDTLWSRALHYLQHRYGGRPYAGIVHRLDKDTSGAVVFARSRAALHALQARFREHAIDREYIALVEGSPPDSGTFDADLVREPGLRRSVARPGQEGRRAITRFRTLERFAGGALVSIRPETGRTHQIRVHFSAAGHPILGDRVYGRLVVPGGGEPIASRQMLHARRLGFPHPATGRPVAAESPLPEDFEKALATLRKRKKSGPAMPGRASDESREKTKRER
jgi:23S rRNA pseudouridine1911/1915/1917 synthase